MMSNERANGDGGADALSYYMSRIAEHELLTKREEQELGRMALRGQEAQKALEEIDDGVELEAKTSLEHLVEQGVFARERFVIFNQRLVASIAKDHLHRSGSHDLVDLIQYGTVALIRASQSFDPRLGNKFSTYATPSIDREIRDQLKLGQQVGLSKEDFFYRGDILQAEMSGGNGRRPTNEEIAEESGVQLDAVIALRGFVPVLSLEAQLMGDDNQFSLKDALPSYEGGYKEVEGIDYFEDCLSILDEEEKELLLLRLDLHPEHTFPDARRREGLLGLEYTGSIFGFSRKTTARKLDKIYAKIIFHLRTTEQFDEHIDTLIARKISHEQSDK